MAGGLISGQPVVCNELSTLRDCLQLEPRGGLTVVNAGARKVEHNMNFGPHGMQFNYHIQHGEMR